MIAPGPTPSPRYLEDSSPGDLFRVRLVAFEFVPWSCWNLAVRVGDLLFYMEKRSDGILVARPDGERLLIPQACTRFIGVQALAGTPLADASGSARLEG